MATTVNHDYLNWLVSQIQIIGPPRTYNELFFQMHSTPFVWSIEGDDSRVNDGRDLRIDYPHRDDLSKYEQVSFLEVLIGLSRRLAFIAGGEADLWAWQLIENLGFANFTDPLNERKRRDIRERLTMVMARTYDPDGSGGFFPLNDPQEDQTQVKLWKQLQAYVNEIQEP
jgi:hypothetical protein